jgi:hypothetical protein
MLIEFRIQTDDNGGVNVVQAQANPNPSLPAQKHLAAAFVPNPANAAKTGGDAPVDGLGTGKPPVIPSLLPSSGSGTMFVIGPIVICGSGPGHAGPGGDAPVDGLGTGNPNGSASSPARNDNPPPTEPPYPPKGRQSRKAR